PSLEGATLGWPTAVHLVHESRRRSESGALEEVLQSFRTSNLELHDYLSAEVYARLDEPSRRLIERTSALSRFDAGLATRLAGQSHPHAALEALARRGLLRTFGAGEHVTYECHELVRRFVRQELETRLGADAWRALEAETADALAGRGEAERALRHYLSAGHGEEAARILRDLAPSLLRHGRAAALQRFLGELPEALMREDVTLAVMQADTQQALGAWDEAEKLFEHVLERCRAVPGVAARRPGVNLREIECRALLGLAQVRGADSPRAALYLSNMAFLLAELGDLAEARTAAEEGLVAAQRFSNRPQECINQQTLAQVLVQSGDLDGALAAVKRAEELN